MLLNAIDRKYDLSLDLNIEREDTVRIDSGKLFHSLGLILAKALSPLCFSLVLRTESSPRSPDLSYRVGL